MTKGPDEYRSWDISDPKLKPLLIQFQIKNSLEPNGILTDETFRLLIQYGGFGIVAQTEREQIKRLILFCQLTARALKPITANRAAPINSV